MAARRIAARNSLAGKSQQQAVEEETVFLRNSIAKIMNLYPENLSPENRYGEIVPLRQQKKVWNAIFDFFPGLLPQRNTFFIRALIVLVICLIFGLPILIYILERPFSAPRDTFVRYYTTATVVVFIAILALQIFYFRFRSYYCRWTLREIAEEIVKAKMRYAEYPINSVDDVEPILLQTIAEKFKIPRDSLNRETQLDADLGFVL